MIYKTTNRADDDIIDIYLFGVREFGSRQAERYHAGLLQCFDRIAEFPTAYRERAEFKPPVRLCFYESHCSSSPKIMS